MSVCFPGVAGEVVRGELQCFGDTVDFAVVRVELVKLDCFGVIYVYELKYRSYLVLCEGVVESLHDFLELVDGEFPTPVCVVG